MKQVLYGALLLVVVGGILGFYQTQKTKQHNAPEKLVSYKEVTYLFDGEPTVLFAESSKETTSQADALRLQIFGNEIAGDLNTDNLPDVVFLVTKLGNNKSTTYYVAVALQTPTGYQGLNMLPLGDEIAPQSMSIDKGVLTVNYATRKSGEATSTPPSLGMSKRFTVDENTLVSID